MSDRKSAPGRADAGPEAGKLPGGATLLRGRYRVSVVGVTTDGEPAGAGVQEMPFVAPGRGR